jgi:elongator complex protein 2
MLAKKKHAEMLEPLTERLAAVDAFLTAFRSTMTPLVQDVVQLSDVCGPAGTDADVQGLLVTDETLAGADMIAKVRSENGLGELRRHVIGVIGAEGETSMQGDAAQLAAAKVGSTAIRGWLAKRQADSPSSGASAHAQQEEFLRLAGRNGSRPVGASVPPLGLSNRALHSADEDIVEPPSASGQALGTAQRSVAGTLTRPPTEEELHSTTLWPELHKIYGHNLELLALDATDEGNLIASSCQAKTEENAVVYLHRTREEGGWKEEARLEGHTLGVTAVRFSPDGNALLTASRDRTWRLYELSEGRWQYKAHERAHKRLLNDVAWLSDGSGFVTASRDKTAILYLRDNGIEGEGFKERTRFSLPQGGGCTAVSTAHDHRTALGCENGDVHIFAPPRAGDWHEAGEPTTLLLQAHHTEAVHELAWQPLQRSAHADEEQEPLLLSVGADAAIRLTRICL